MRAPGVALGGCLAHDCMRAQNATSHAGLSFVPTCAAGESRGAHAEISTGTEPVALQPQLAEPGSSSSWRLTLPRSWSTALTSPQLAPPRGLHTPRLTDAH